MDTHDLLDFLRTVTIFDLVRINGYGVYGGLGAAMGCVVLPPKTFREAVVRVLCGVVFSFTLTPLAGPLLGGIVEKNVGARAAEGLYDAPAGVGILVGMLSYFVATFAMSVARHTTRDVIKYETTLHDIRTRNSAPDPYRPTPAPAPDMIDNDRSPAPSTNTGADWAFVQPNCPASAETIPEFLDIDDLPQFPNR